METKILFCGGKFSAAWAMALLALAMLTGCSQGGPELGGAATTDSNGYLCGKCGYKFYTDEAVYAEFCPKCKDTSIRQVVAYRCEKDKHITMSTNGHGAEKCEQCQSPIDGKIMPQSSDLKAWGAEKKTKAEVCK